MTTAKRTSSKPSAKSEPKPNKPYVDLSKLRKTSLKRYKKHFNLDVKADSKTELLEAVGRHFAQMPVREADVAHDFYCFLRGLRNKHRTQQAHHQQQHAQVAKQQQQQQHHQQQHHQQQHQQQQHQQQQQAHPPQPAESHAQSPSPLHPPDVANSTANGDVKTSGNKSNGNNANSHAAAHTPPASSTPTPSSPSPHAPGSSSVLGSAPAGGGAGGSDGAHPMGGPVTQPQSASSAMPLAAPTASVGSGSGR